MRRFLVEAVVDAIIALGVILLLSLLSVGQPFPFGATSTPILALRGAGLVGFITWAAVLVLVNRFARPIIVALTGRVLLSDDGCVRRDHQRHRICGSSSLIAPIKIATVAASVRALAPHRGHVCIRSSRPSSTAVLGLNRPSFAPEGQRSVWRILESLPTPRRNVFIENLRLQQVYDLIYAHRARPHPRPPPRSAACGAGSSDGSSARRTRSPAKPGRSGSG